MDKHLENCLLEAQSHSGLPKDNYYSDMTREIAELCYGDKYSVEDFLSVYMPLVHEQHKKYKTWKSYDW